MILSCCFTLITVYIFPNISMEIRSELTITKSTDKGAEIINNFISLKNNYYVKEKPDLTKTYRMVFLLKGSKVTTGDQLEIK